MCAKTLFSKKDQFVQIDFARTKTQECCALIESLYSLSIDDDDDDDGHRSEKHVEVSVDKRRQQLLVFWLLLLCYTASVTVGVW